MRVALLSDIHSNLEALEAVVADAESKGVTHYVILGDIVGYGPNPEECVRLVRKINPRFVVMGNHDMAVAGVWIYMNRDAEAAVVWNRANMSVESIEWLKGLPFTANRGDCMFVHSSLVHPEKFNYFLFTLRPFHFAEQQVTGKRVCFLGHSHRPEMVEWNEEENAVVPAVPFFDSGAPANFSQDTMSVVNVGSVGQPRDEQWKATYVICDMNNWKPQTAQLVRVEYDVDKTTRKIFDSSLPEYCGVRLFKHR